MKFEGIEQAAKEFNNWQGTASVMLDKSDGKIWTDVFIGSDWKEYKSDDIVYIYHKGGVDERNAKISAERLQKIAEQAMKYDFECLVDLLMSVKF